MSRRDPQRVMCVLTEFYRLRLQGSGRWWQRLSVRASPRMARRAFKRRGGGVAHLHFALARDAPAVLASITVEILHGSALARGTLR